MKKKIIVYLRAELTVLELLAELLKGLVTSVLLVTFLAVILGIFSIVFLFSVGFRQASTMIYRPSFRKLRAISFEFISEFSSGFTLWGQSLCAQIGIHWAVCPKKWDYFHTLYLFCQAQSRTSSTKDWLLRADDEFHASITSLCPVERIITEFVTWENLIDEYI